VLVDTGLGQADYVHKPGILRIFELVTRVPLNPEEAVAKQIVRLGYVPEAVDDIVLTHMHFDHSGGLPDFPQARVHIHRCEYEAFRGRRQRWTDWAYVRRHLLMGQARLELYEDRGDTWRGLGAIRLPFEPEMWLVPLFGHTRGHCGVATQTEEGWLFHVGDAAPIGLGEYVPEWLTKWVLGPQAPRLRAFGEAHPEVLVTTGHMWLDFFEEQARA
jgi:glyoxylase-like metal-dependent hydrolase (beta-lactamase superfamily II)